MQEYTVGTGRLIDGTGRRITQITQTHHANAALPQMECDFLRTG